MGVHLFDVCMHAYVCVGKGLLGGTWVLFLRHEQNIRILGPYFLLVFFGKGNNTSSPYSSSSVSIVSHHFYFFSRKLSEKQTLPFFESSAVFND